MKKQAIIIFSVLCLLICAGIAAQAAEEVFLYENFDDAPSVEGQKIEGWNGWSVSSAATDENPSDSEFTIITEPYTENKIASLYRIKSDSTSPFYMLKKRLTKKAYGGLVSLEVKVKRRSASANYFWMHLVDSKGKKWEFYLHFPTRKWAIEQTKEVVFGDSNCDGLQLGRWYDFQFIFDLDKSRFFIKESGEAISEWLDIPKALNTGSISEFYFGTTRANAGNYSEVQIDDIIIRRTYPFEIMQASFNKHSLSDGVFEIKADVSNNTNSNKALNVVMAWTLDGKMQKVSHTKWDSTDEFNYSALTVSGSDKGKGALKLFAFDGDGISPMILPVAVDKNGIDGVRSVKTYYVSPSGNDGSDGTEEKPWKTIKKAVASLKAGDTLIVEDGVYNEAAPTFFKSSGTKNSHITVKARNSQKAVIVYSEDTKLVSKFNILQNQDYIDVYGLSFKQNGVTTAQDNLPTGDIFIECQGDYCRIEDNFIRGGFEDGIKLYMAKDCVIKGNTIENMEHEGIDLVNCNKISISGNSIFETGRVGIMAKGGSRDCAIYNNVIFNKSKYQSTAAITVGGSTDKVSTYDIRANTGYELYNSRIFNNIIYSENDRIVSGFLFVAAKDCEVYNNTVANLSSAGFRFVKRNGKESGWKWDSETVGIRLNNNIVYSCLKVYRVDDETAEYTSDYNLFYGNNEYPQEEHSVYKNPLFTNLSGGNFTLRSTSPAIGKGIEISPRYTGFYKTVIETENIDYNMNERTLPWNMGACGVK